MMQLLVNSEWDHQSFRPLEISYALLFYSGEIYDSQLRRGNNKNISPAPPFRYTGEFVARAHFDA